MGALPDAASPGPTDLGPTLGDARNDRLLTPTKAGDSVHKYQWEPHPAPGSSYRVVVYTDENRDRQLGASGIIDACEWIPSPDKLPVAGLDAIYWTLEIFPLGAGAPDEYIHSPRIDL